MKMNYVRGGIMALLLKEVSRAAMPGFWLVHIGGQFIGHIYKKDGFYKTVSTGGHEYTFNNFMQALAVFISPAIEEIDKQGSVENNYVGKVGVVSYSDFYFSVDEVRYNLLEEVTGYILRGEDVIKSHNGPRVKVSPAYITSFSLRYQQLMKLISVV